MFPRFHLRRCLKIVCISVSLLFIWITLIALNQKLTRGSKIINFFLYSELRQFLDGKKGEVLPLRLLSAFQKQLDCPRNFSLSFLGLPHLEVNLNQDPTCIWIKNTKFNLERNFVTFGEEMAVLKKVTLDPSQFSGSKGGESIESVFNQNEDAEYFQVKPGFFTLICQSSPTAIFHVSQRNYRRHNHLNDWANSIRCQNQSSPQNAVARLASNITDLTRDMLSSGHISGVTFALQRYEYANLYHTMLDWYNVFLTILILGLDPKTTTFLIVDGHPWGKLDGTWASLFSDNKVLRAGHLRTATTFDYMVWAPNGYHCPLFDTERENVPFLHELRSYFFMTYGVTAKESIDCANKVQVLMIRRRDYLAHPQNTKGLMRRKILNEDEIYKTLKASVPGIEIQTVQLELINMKQQLQLAANADILLGMHGAGMTHSIFLHPKAGLVELFPMEEPGNSPSVLFKTIAKWRGLHYDMWENRNKTNAKPDFYTYIPPTIVVDLVTKMRDTLCNKAGNGRF